MNSLSLKIRFEKNTDLLISPKELRDQYLFGTPITSNESVLSDSSLKFYIQSSTEQLENYLNLLFKKQVYQETMQFVAEDYWNWAYLRTTYPVVCPLLVEGFLNTTKQVTYPKEWLSSRRTSDGILYHRNLTIVPAGSSSNITHANLYTGILPNLSYLGLQRIPDYWTLDYVTGFDKVPTPIIDAISKLSSINVLRILSDNILMPGVQSFSLSIDGLSQSIGSKGYDQRIKAHLDDLNQRILPELKMYYRGISFGVA